MQKTNFAIEVLIHDDASTDGTEEIIREYESKFPEIIKSIYEKENQWVKGRRGSAIFNFPRAKGKYIAMCEGDDYWTDPLKLQKQVDFLEKNQDYVLTCHRYSVFDDDYNKWYLDNQDKLFEKKTEGFSFTYPFDSWITKTLTVVFRSSSLEDVKEYNGIMRDAILMYFIMKNGKGYIFNDNMGVYRLHNGGVVSKQSTTKKIFDSYYVLRDLFYHEKNMITRRMYYSKYFSVFVVSRGKILFNERFELLKFMSLVYYFPVKMIRLFKRFLKKES